MYHVILGDEALANMRVLFLLALAIAAVAAVPAPSDRIIGGSVTTISQYPHMVALLYSSNLNTFYQACGGTIINTRSILTAAHCPWGDAPINWRLRVGSTNANSGGVVHNVQGHNCHPQYNTWTLDSDICLMRSATNIAYVNGAVQPATIAGANYYPADNSVVWATGWGRTSTGIWGSGSEQLRHVQIWTVNQQTCVTRYRELGLTVTDNMLCSGWLDVGGRDQCQGDSGGPLHHNNVIVGVCSWGESCALARYPGVNARVSRYTAWIQANA